MVFPDDRKHVDAGRGARAEQLYDLTFRIDVARLPRFEPDYDFVAARRLLWQRGMGGDLNIDVVHDPRIVRHDVKKIPGLLQCADDGVMRALQDPDDASFRTSGPAFRARVIFISSDAGDDTVAMHC